MVYIWSYIIVILWYILVCSFIQYTVDSDCMMSIDKMEFYIRACFSLHILFLQIIYYNRFNLLLFSFVANIQRTEQEAQTIATVVKSKSLEILENSFLKDLRGSTWEVMVRSTWAWKTFLRKPYLSTLGCVSKKVDFSPNCDWI